MAAVFSQGLFCNVHQQSPRPKFEGSRILPASTLHAFPTASSMWVAQELARLATSLYIHQVVRLGMLFTEKCYRTLYIAFHHRTSACTQQLFTYNYQ